MRDVAIISFAQLPARGAYPDRNEIELIANDRLLAPNTDEAARALETALLAFATTLFDGQSCKVARNAEADDRLAVSVTVPQAEPLDTLLRRLGG